MEKQFEYKIQKQVIPEIRELLKSTIYGTSGFKYSHLDTDKKLNALISPDFHTIWNNQELVAVAAYCNRTVMVNKKPYNAYYIRYFSVKPNYQGKGIGQYLTKEIETHYLNSLNQKTVFYGYIENKNLQSLAVSHQFKQEKIGQFKPVLFSRFFPKKDDRFENIDPIEFVKFINQQYKSHALLHTNKIGYQGHCYGIRKNGELVAAIQANPVGWKIHSSPGVLGWLGRYVFHFLPVLGRLSPRTTFKYVAFEGCCALPENQHLIIALMESCLALHQRHVGIMYLDVAELNFPYFKRSNRMGFMRKIQEPPAVQFLCNFIQIQDTEKEKFYELPKYISSFDLT